MALRTDAAALARKPQARKQRKEEAVTALGVVAPPPIQIESPNFNGSLATLFMCVRERKLDLLDIPLMPVCEAYFIYLLQAHVKDLDEAAAALSALAYLLERKAWALIPIAEPEPENEELLELIAPTAYEYDAAIAALQIWHEEREQVFFRPPDGGNDAYEIPFDIGNVTIQDLARAFEKLLTKVEPDEPKVLNKPRRSISEQMKVVMRVLSADWKALDELLKPPFTREDVVYWFLALLELIRLGQASVRLRKEEVEFSRSANQKNPAAKTPTPQHLNTQTP